MWEPHTLKGGYCQEYSIKYIYSTSQISKLSLTLCTFSITDSVAGLFLTVVFPSKKQTITIFIPNMISNPWAQILRIKIRFKCKPDIYKIFCKLRSTSCLSILIYILTISCLAISKLVSLLAVHSISYIGCVIVHLNLYILFWSSFLFYLFSLI